MGGRGFLALALVVLAIGCDGGGSSKEASTGSSEALTGQTVSTQSEVPDVTAYVVRSAGFSIAIPRSWKAVTSDDLNGNQVDSDLLPLLPELADPKTTVRFIGLDTDEKNGFRTNMVVTVERAPDFPVEALASQDYAEQFARTFPAPLLSPVKNELVSLSAGKAAHMWYTYRSPKSEANRVLTAHHWRLVAGDKVYSLLANVLPQREQEYIPTFIYSAVSLRPLE